VKRIRSHTGVLTWVSDACVVGGVVVLLSPLVWIAWTGWAATDAQTAALAAWERGAPRHASRSGRLAATSGGFVLTIPRLGLRRWVPEGATVDHLRRYGVGHISWTAEPGGWGVVGIAGHRTTYGAPFFALDRLRSSDLIQIDDGRRRYVYSVVGHTTVTPDRAGLLQGRPADREVALVTCAPPYSAALRLVVFGTLRATADDAGP